MKMQQVYFLLLPLVKEMQLKKTLQKKRSNIILAKKKAISCFISRISMPWDNIHKTGNPRRSDAINKLIIRIYKAEASGLGNKCNRKRAVEMEELKLLVQIMRTDVKFYKRALEKYKFLCLALV